MSTDLVLEYALQALDRRCEILEAIKPVGGVRSAQTALGKVLDTKKKKIVVQLPTKETHDEKHVRLVAAHGESSAALSKAKANLDKNAEAYRRMKSTAGAKMSQAEKSTTNSAYSSAILAHRAATKAHEENAKALEAHNARRPEGRAPREIDAEKAAGLSKAIDVAAAHRNTRLGKSGEGETAAATAPRGTLPPVQMLMGPEERRKAAAHLLKDFAPAHSAETGKFHDDAVTAYADKHGIDTEAAKFYVDKGRTRAFGAGETKGTEDTVGKHFGDIHREAETEGHNVPKDHAEVLIRAGQVAAHTQRMLSDATSKGFFKKSPVDSSGAVTSPHHENNIHHHAWMQGYLNKNQKLHPEDHPQQASWKDREESHKDMLVRVGEKPLASGGYKYPALKASYAEGQAHAEHAFQEDAWTKSHKGQLERLGASPEHADKIVQTVAAHARALGKTREEAKPEKITRTHDYTHPESSHFLHLKPEHFSETHARLQKAAAASGAPGTWELKHKWHPDHAPHKDEGPDSASYQEATKHADLHQTKLIYHHPTADVTYKLGKDMDWKLDSARAPEGLSGHKDRYGHLTMQAVTRGKEHTYVDKGGVGIMPGEVKKRGEISDTWATEQRILPKINQLWRVKTANDWHERVNQKQEYKGQGATAVDKESGNTLYHHKSGTGLTRSSQEAKTQPVVKVRPREELSGKMSPQEYDKNDMEKAFGKTLPYSQSTARAMMSRKPEDRVKMHVKVPGTKDKYHVHQVEDEPVVAREDLKVKRVVATKPVQRLPYRKPGESDLFVDRDA